MYNNTYYNPQLNVDRINNQIAELEKIRNQLQQPIQPTNLTQNFQLAPTNRDVIKYANSMDEVKREMVVGETPFFSKDMSVVWIKNNKGEIKTYELTEIVDRDEKDIKIEYLQAQIEDLKKGMKKYESYSNVDEFITKPTESKESSNVETVSKSTKKSKWPKKDNSWFNK